MRFEKVVKNMISLVLIITLDLFIACSEPKDESDRTKETTIDITPTDTAEPSIAPTKASVPSVESQTDVTGEKAITLATSNIASQDANHVSTKPRKDTISIKYIGNSCFYLTFPDGTRIVTDPYGKSFEASFGTFPKMDADVITISHDHEDHIGGIDLIGGNPKIIKADQISKRITVGDVKIIGYTSDHVANMGTNIIYVFKYKDLKIVDMGETDNIASKEAKNAVKNANAILAYAGEYGNIKNTDSFKKLYNFNIKVIIPQHYSNNHENLFYGEPTIDDILKDVPKNIKVTETNEFLVTNKIKKQFVNLDRWK